MPRLVYDWRGAIQAFYDEGHGFVECQKRFGFTHGAWNKAIRRGKMRAKPTRFTDRRRRYDWTEVQAYYDEGNSYRDCQARFGFCAMAWHKARQRGDLRSRPAGMPIEELLAGPSRCRTHVKSRLLHAGLLKNRCDECGLSEWRGRPLSIQIDHINGVRDDHRLENLRMLCPNCHSQTHTYGGRNARQRKPLQEKRGAV